MDTAFMHVKIWSNHNGAAKILWYRPQFLLLSLLTRQYGPKCAGLIVINYIRVCTPHHLVVLNVTFLLILDERHTANTEAVIIIDGIGRNEQQPKLQA